MNDCDPVEMPPTRTGWVWCSACSRSYPPNSVHAAVLVTPPAPTGIEDDR